METSVPKGSTLKELEQEYQRLKKKAKRDVRDLRRQPQGLAAKLRDIFFGNN